MSLNLKQLWGYCIENYKYTPYGLRLTDVTFTTASSVYEYGVLNGVGLSRAVISIVGYRYRRMEILVKQQLKLYEVEKVNSWRHKKIIIKCKGTYIGEKNVDVDVELLYPDPFLEELDEEWCHTIFQLMLEETPFYNTPVEWGRVEYDIVGYTDIRYDTIIVTSPAKMDIYTWKARELKKHYSFEFKVDTTLYLPFGVFKRGVRRPYIYVRLTS